jgi:hypothetical protein
MNTQKLNDTIQWVGTGFVLIMYYLMNLRPDLTPYNLIAGLCGSIAYFTWTIRVKNYPQMLINVVAMTLCVAGLYNYSGA